MTASAPAGDSDVTRLFEDRRRAESFGAVADRYDRARPSYPPALVDAVLRGQPDGCEVLDVGCGTGIAARLFADRGCRVQGVEADERMAVVARRHGLAVEVSPFEQWEDQGRRFDVITSAQAWHWVSPTEGAAKAAQLLRPGGRIAVFWNLGHPRADLKAAFSAVYDRIAPGVDEYSVLLGHSGGGRFRARTSEFENDGHFEDTSIETFPWDRVYSREEWLDHLPTHSDHSTLEPAQLEQLLAGIGQVIDNAGGSFAMHYEAVAKMATRNGLP